MDSATNLASAAAWYAEHDLPVFPCMPRGKAPFTAHGFKDATTDHARIAEWWRERPDANVGMPTGEASGLIVIDIDPRNGGDESWSSLVSKHGQVPETAEQLTGGGGRHIVFQHPGGIRCGTLARGIDIKGDGGYIVVAPSVHVSGNPYRWNGNAGATALLKPAEAPSWLIDYLAMGNGTHADTTPGSEKWPPGERNVRLTSLAGTMRRRGVSREAIEAALLLENQQRCAPPLHDDEVRQIAASVAGYPPGEDAVIVEEWPEPVPFINRDVPPLSSDLLPGFLGDMVTATARATETPLELAALQGLSVAAASIAKKVIVRPEPGYTEPVNIFTAVGMESGNRKTAVLIRMTAPFVMWERAERERLAPEVSRIASQRKTLEARIQRLRQKAAKAPDASALMDEIAELEASLPEVPTLPRLWVQDITPEQLGVQMAENGERIALFSDEGGIFEILAGRYNKGQPNLDLFLQAHAGAPVRVDRGSRPPILMNHPVLTLGIAPQPDVLESLKDKPGFRGRGLLARILYALPRSPLGMRGLNARPVPSAIEEAYNRGIGHLLRLSPPIADGGEWQPWCLRFAPKAYDAWKDFQRSIETLMREGGKLCFIKDWASKLPGAAARVAGILHCVVTDPSESQVIDEDTMERALSLVTILIDHALAVFGLMERDTAVEDAQRLLRWIQKHGQATFTVRECFCAHQSRFKRVDAIHPPLRLLEEYGYIRPGPRRRVAHRPSEIFEVNPKALEPPL